MAQQFKDQGGAAASDPSWLRRHIMSRVMSKVSKPETLLERRARAEKQRIADGRPHCVEYFHQVDDGYSHLIAQRLQQFAARYDVSVKSHLVGPPKGKNVAEPDLLSRLSRYDSYHIAHGYGLAFPYHLDDPDPSLVALTTAILANQHGEHFLSVVESVSTALWSADKPALEMLASAHGRVDGAQVEEVLARGNARRAALKHYSGAMLYYEGEWYWGIDRLYQLELRLVELGLDKDPEKPLLAPRPAVASGDLRDDGSLRLEVYASLRSPYTAVIFDKAVQLARDTGVTLDVRPVLPMVMRGVPATREKGMYIFMDAAREARFQGVPYGKFFDPIGNPARQCYSLYPWAKSQGKDIELISAFLRHAFVLGVNTNNNRGLRKVVEAAGLNWREAKQHLGSDGWQEILESNRQAMYESGLWGVPSFRLLDSDGETLLALWGQDRLWVIAEAIREQLLMRANASKK